MDIDTITDRKQLQRILDERDLGDSPSVEAVRNALERVEEVAEAVFQYTAYPEEGDAQLVYETWKFAVVARLADSEMVEDGLDSIFASANVDDEGVREGVRAVFDTVTSEYMDDPPDSEYVVIRKHGGWRQGEGWMTGRLRYLTEELGLSPEEALDYYFVDVIGLETDELAEERAESAADIETRVQQARTQFR